MRLTTSLLIAFCLCFIGYAASGQEKLKTLESKLRSPTDAAPIPSASAAKPGYLGFLPDENAAPGKGVVVLEVTKGVPSETAGLRAGDLITAIDEKECKSVDEFDAVMSKTRPGQKLKLTVLRAGKVENLTVTLGRRPDELPGAAPAADPATDPTEAANPGEAPDTSVPPPTRPGPSLAPAAEPAADPTAEPAPPDRPILRARAADAAAPAAADPAGAAEAAAPITDPLAAPADAAEPPAADPLRPRRPPGLAPEDDPLAAPAEPARGGAFPADASGRASLGIVVVPLTEQARAQYGLTVRRGALITTIRPDSAADQAGLPLGGVIVAIDGRRVDDADDLVGAIRAARPGQEVELTYYQGANLARKTVRLAPAAATAAVPADSGSSVGPGLRFPAGGDRPILRRVEEAVEGLRRPGGISTTVDPSQIAENTRQIELLLEKLEAIESRLQLIEAKLGNEPPAVNAERPAAEPPGAERPAAGGGLLAPATP